MNSASQWLDGNTRYMSAAVSWVRAVLQAQIQKPAAPAPALPKPRDVAPAQTPPQSHSLWVVLGLRKELSTTAPSIALPLPPAPPAPMPVRDAASAMLAIAESMDPPPALISLSQRLGLTDFERNVLLLCAAMELDTSLAALCAKAQGDEARQYPTFALAFAMFADAAWDALSPERPLRYWRLLEINQPAAVPLTVSPIRADERIVNLLKGVTYLDDRLSALLLTVPDPGDGVPPSQQSLAQAIADQLKAALTTRRFPVVQLLGRDPDSKLTVAGAASRMIGLQIYRLQLGLLPAVPAELESFVRLWERECLLLSVGLYLDVDADGAGSQAALVDHLLDWLTGVVFLATRNILGGGTVPPIVIEAAKPTAEEQRDCWATALGPESRGLADQLAAQFNLDIGTIREIVRRAGVEATTDSSSSAGDLWDLSRGLLRPRLDVLAQRVAPGAGWDDIVLPSAESALLRRIADQVGARTTVYKTWGFGERMTRGLGISVLFAGPTGCGKTMAAEVIANDLQLDLFRIDLSAVVSKYIGETEKNLRRLFDAAEDGGAILFFDEADALFGKRSEVKDSHDRYANIEINYLLQRMESYGGLAILATNVKSSLDQAFLRRLRFVVDFPFPAAAERKAIWQKTFPAKTPTDGLDFDRLARLSLTGGSIAVIALNAAFQAARAGTPVTMPIVLDAARIEFRKLARPINETDFRWQVRSGAVA